jgi:hypothetical protein
MELPENHQDLLLHLAPLARQQVGCDWAADGGRLMVGG